MNTSFHIFSVRTKGRFTRLIAVGLGALVLVAPPRFAEAQSSDERNPTTLTSREITSRIAPNSRHQHYWYSFTAGPGEVELVAIAKPYSDSVAAVCGVICKLYDEDTNQIVSILAQSGFDEVKDRASLTRRTRMKMHLETYDNAESLDARERGGTFRVTLGGAISLSGSAYDPGDARARPNCLPERGTLRVKMRDGSVRTIDLSQTQEITIEP